MPLLNPQKSHPCPAHPEAPSLGSSPFLLLQLQALSGNTAPLEEGRGQVGTSLTPGSSSFILSGDPYQLLQGDGPALMPPVPPDPPRGLFGELEGP